MENFQSSAIYAIYTSGVVAIVLFAISIIFLFLFRNKKGDPLGTAFVIMFTVYLPLLSMKFLGLPLTKIASHIEKLRDGDESSLFYFVTQTLITMFFFILQWVIWSQVLALIWYYFG